MNTFTTIPLPQEEYNKILSELDKEGKIRSVPYVAEYAPGSNQSDEPTGWVTFEHYIRGMASQGDTFSK